VDILKERLKEVQNGINVTLLPENVIIPNILHPHFLPKLRIFRIQAMFLPRTLTIQTPPHFHQRL
jgi:hypothetical protein